MDSDIEKESPTEVQEEAAENEPKNKTECMETICKSKSIDRLKEKSKDELNALQSGDNESSKNNENNCEPSSDLETNVGGQKDIPGSVLKDIVNGGKDDDKDSEEKPNDQGTLNQNSENVAMEEVENSKNEKPNDEECNDQSTSNEDAEKEDAVNADDGNTASEQTTDPASSTSTQVQLREKCKYGSQCYRLNAEHKATFSHPGDTDYDAPDNRPECPYGHQCYRKNPQHKVDYKHTSTKRKRTQNPAQTATLDDLSDFEDSMEESVDESEYDGSFIDDDDLDDDDDFGSDFESDLDEEDEDGDVSEDEDGKKKKKKKVKNKANGEKRKKTKND